MAKMDYDTILRCANTDCYHNRDGYNCTCAVIALNKEGHCALRRPKVKPTSNDGGKPAQNKTDITHGVLDY